MLSIISLQRDTEKALLDKILNSIKSDHRQPELTTREEGVKYRT